MRSGMGFLLISALVACAGPALAADYAVPAYAVPTERRVAQIVTIDRGPNPYCGPRYGCPITDRVRHRSLGMGYPSGFDPRTRGEPAYFYGPTRTYVRFVDPLYPDRISAY